MDTKGLMVFIAPEDTVSRRCGRAGLLDLSAAGVAFESCNDLMAPGR